MLISQVILGDPGVDSGGEGKPERVTKMLEDVHKWKPARDKRMNVADVPCAYRTGAWTGFFISGLWGGP